ncbi:cold-shock protein [Rhodococcus sp. BH5]|uniref:cold-shock protein n=1 Tax=Rhodococcus sp. BH5 TaxID=2871702 RepID=UPI0022CD95B2|nr:cold-shock protein [Rhodococcus sp. BH5]MCZ9635353.1 cold-shock protein [Rhodococcus sp. BH5]
MPKGTVKWFNSDKGFGFIEPDLAGVDLFADYSQIICHGFKSLECGQRVEFEILDSPRGAEAVNISIL